MFFHSSGSFATFGFAGSEDEDGFAMGADGVADEAVGGVDFEPFGTPAKFVAGGRVAFANEVDPEGVFDDGLEEVRLDGEVLLLGGGINALEGLFDPLGDDGVFDAGVGADDVDGFVALFGGKGGDRCPN